MEKKKIESKYDSLSCVLGQMTMCNEFTTIRGREEKLIATGVFNGWVRSLALILEVEIPKKCKK